MSDNNDEVSRDDLLRMAVDVVAAYLSNNQVPTSQISDIIHSVFDSLNTLEVQPVEAPPTVPKPAAPVRKSVTPDYIICLEDGKKLKMLKRHLRTTYNMTPEEYRAKWSLPPGLSNGRSQLRPPAVRLRQADRPRSQGTGNRSGIGLPSPTPTAALRCCWSAAVRGEIRRG